MARSSAQNSGAAPQTFNSGGGNGFSRQFYDRNQDYMGAGDWRNTDRNPSDDGYRIDARAGASMPGTGPGTGKTSVPMGRGFGGLDYFHALQNRDLPAFRQPNQGTSWGLGNSAQEAGANLMQSGNMLLADGTYVPDTMYNRTLGSNPYSGGNQAPQQAPQGPNEDQQRWAQQFAGSQGAPSSGPTPFADALKNVRSHPLIAGKGAPSGSQPLNFSRSALVEGAKKSGDFDKVMADYNAKAAAAGTGMQMDSMGNINPLSKLADEQGTSPFARATLGAGAEDIRARRNFATGNQLASFNNPMLNPNADEMNPQPMMGSKFNPRYGLGSSLIGSANTPKVTSGGVMPNPITGQAMKMNPYLKDQDAVTKTKSGPNAQQAGENFFNAKSMASAMKSAKPLDAAKGKYFRDKVRGTA